MTAPQKKQVIQPNDYAPLAVNSRGENVGYSTEFGVYPQRGYFCEFNLNQPVFWEVLGKLDSLAKLQDGWNGKGSVAISSQIIGVVRNLMTKQADLIASPFFVVPTHAGGVQLEWVRGLRELELEFVSPHRIDYLFTDEEYGISEESSCSVADETVIRGLITRVNGG